MREIPLIDSVCQSPKAEVMTEILGMGARKNVDPNDPAGSG